MLRVNTPPTKMAAASNMTSDVTVAIRVMISVGELVFHLTLRVGTGGRTVLPPGGRVWASVLGVHPRFVGVNRFKKLFLPERDGKPGAAGSAKFRAKSKESGKIEAVRTIRLPGVP